MAPSRAILLLSIVAQIAIAQSLGDQEKARAIALLQSPRPIDQAWGAYLAGPMHSSGLEQPLTGALRSHADWAESPFGSEEGAAIAALFDAAIESGISVPVSVLKPYETTWIDSVVILLSRLHDAESEEYQLHFAEEERFDRVWLAANNLLFSRKSNLWFAQLLENLAPIHRFDVVDESGHGAASGIASVSCGDGMLAVPKGFPPSAIYDLVQDGKPGDVLVATGPQDSYYRRTAIPMDRQVGIGLCSSALNRTEIRAGYIALATGLSKNEAVRRLHAGTTVTYRGASAFQDEVASALDLQVSEIRELIRLAINDGFAPPIGSALATRLDGERYSPESHRTAARSTGEGCRVSLAP